MCLLLVSVDQYLYLFQLQQSASDTLVDRELFRCALLLANQFVVRIT